MELLSLKNIGAVILFAFIYDRIYQAIKGNGNFKIYNHEPGPCRLVPDIVEGSEDIEVLSNGLALVSAGMRDYFNVLNPATINKVGRIYLFDFNKPNEKVKDIKIKGNIDLKTFCPHGITSWENKKTGDTVVFVLNHLPGSEGESIDTIEKFRFNYKKLTLEHLASIHHKSTFWKMNDLVATGENSFYFTNFFYNTKPLWMKIEQNLPLFWDSVGYYDGTSSSILLTGLSAANGISLSKDSNVVYVNAYNHGLNIYDRQANNSLVLNKKIPLPGTKVDNVNVDWESGDIWIGAHNDPGSLREGQKWASQVLLLKMKDTVTVQDVREVYSNDGEVLEGSSVAAHFKNKLLIGTVFHKLLYCQWDPKHFGHYIE